MTNDEIARASATEWCRCYKCDKIVHNLVNELAACHQWYNGYRTALILDNELHYRN